MTGVLDPRSGWEATRCPIARALEVVGTRSAFLLLREAFYGTTPVRRLRRAGRDQRAGRRGPATGPRRRRLARAGAVPGTGSADAPAVPADGEGCGPVPGAGRADAVGRPVARPGRGGTDPPGLRGGDPSRASAARPATRWRWGTSTWSGARLLPPGDDAAEERGLPDVLEVVGDDADEPGREGDRWVPRAVDDPRQIGVDDGLQVGDRPGVDGVVVAGQEARLRRWTWATSSGPCP